MPLVGMSMHPSVERIIQRPGEDRMKDLKRLIRDYDRGVISAKDLAHEVFGSQPVPGAAAIAYSFMEGTIDEDALLTSFRNITE